MKTERHYAQRHSKVSELLAQEEEQWINSRMPKCGIDKLKVESRKTKTLCSTTI